ncbi:MAG: hypothetical protein RIR62_99 [Pseudomonadota bacterium]|jgi:hypothetical protein
MRRRRARAAAAAAAATPKVQLLGLCRFSVPSLGAFKVEHDSIDDRRAMLYAPDRLAHRLAWFRHVALPALRAQTDPDFRLVLLLGEDLPEPWRGLVLDLVADVPQVAVEYAPAGPHREVCAEAMRRHVDPDADVVAQFRLDDDDAVAVDFVARTRAEVPFLMPHFLRGGLCALDWCRGVLLTEVAGTLTPTLRRAQLWTPALVILTRPEAEKMVLDYPHHLVWRQMPVLSLVDEVMFLRGAHGGNDSIIAQEKRPETLPAARWPDLLRQRFGIDLAAFRTVIEVLRKD